MAVLYPNIVPGVSKDVPHVPDVPNNDVPDVPDVGLDAFQNKLQRQRQRQREHADCMPTLEALSCGDKHF